MSDILLFSMIPRIYAFITYISLWLMLTLGLIVFMEKLVLILVFVWFIPFLTTKLSGLIEF